jgi:type I restriction enzyme S subunit
MKLERFIEKFEQFADAPNAVAKMRELVFELAARGRLIPEALERPVVDDIKLMGDIVELVMGQAPPGDECNTEGQGTIFVKVGEFGALYPEQTAWTTNPLKFAKRGDVLVCVVGATVGKLNLAIDCAIGRSVAAIRPSPTLDTKFLYYSLMPYTLRLRRNSRGSAQGVIGKAELNAVSLWAPSLAVQQRIVAKVDKLMALCDRLEVQQQVRDTRHAALARASLARFAEAPTPANLDFLFHQSYTITPADLRKSILTLAVQGKLVPQKPSDGLAQEAFIGLTPLATEVDENRDIPDQWALCSYRSLTSLVTSGSRGWKEYYSKSGAIFVRTQNIKTDRLVLDDVAYVDLPKSAEGMRAQILQEDILITITGANVTKAARVEEQIPEAYVSQHIALTRPRWSVMSKWLHLCFISHGAARGTLEQLAYGDKPGLNLNNIRDLILPIPPLAEQRRIVAKVDQLMALVDQLEAQLTEANAKSAALLEAVIHELLNPSAEVIDLASYRAAIGCYTISRMSDKPYFGRTAAMKMFYLAQAHVGMHLDLHPEREAAGPLDQWIYRFEDEAQRQGWFKSVENTSNGKMKVEYRPGKMLAEQAAQGENLLSPEQRKEFDRMLGLLSVKKTEEVEIIATLFAAWNDFLLDGHAPSDDEIVMEVRENWHVKKERFTPALLRQWLGWLRQNNLVPQGRLPHTVHQSKLSLN